MKLKKHPGWKVNLPYRTLIRLTVIRWWRVLIQEENKQGSAVWGSSELVIWETKKEANERAIIQRSEQNGKINFCLKKQPRLLNRMTTRGAHCWEEQQQAQVLKLIRLLWYLHHHVMYMSTSTLTVRISQWSQWHYQKNLPSQVSQRVARLFSNFIVLSWLLVTL